MSTASTQQLEYRYFFGAVSHKAPFKSAVDSHKGTVAVD